MVDFSNKELINDSDKNLSFSIEFQNINYNKDNEILNLNVDEDNEIDINKNFAERGDLNIFSLEKSYTEK